MSSARVQCCVLFAAAFCLLPVPYQLIEPGLAPTLRVVLLAGIFGLITLADGFSELSRVVLPLIAVQAVAYSLLLWWLCRRLVRLVESHAGSTWSTAFVASIALALFVAGSFEIYVTPASSSARRTSWSGLLD